MHHMGMDIYSNFYNSKNFKSKPNKWNRVCLHMGILKAEKEKETPERETGAVHEENERLVQDKTEAAEGFDCEG